jgi:putative nucleotidyltransferase with HDIG domain
MKKRILFADDDPAFIELYRVLFESDEADWELESANSGAEALRLMDAAPCDVLVAKWRMPGMTGLELFREVTTRHAHTARIVVSEACDHGEVAEGLEGRHLFIARPIGIDVLRTTIRRVCSIQNAALDAKIEKLLAHDYRVPSLPSLYFAILRAMDSPNSSISDIGALIARDLGMTAQILQMVNSAYFGIARRISNPMEAVQLLGLQRVRSVALSAHVFSSFDQMRMKHFPLASVWKHCLAASRMAQEICRVEKADRAMTDDAQLACMLHDVGKVMLASGDPDRYQAAAALARERQAPLLEVEREVFGVSHADVGAYLFGKWGLPISVVEAVALHHAPESSALDCFTPLTAVHVANCLEHEVGDAGMELAAPKVDADYLTRIGLADQLPVWREAIEDLEATSAARAC